MLDSLETFWAGLPLFDQIGWVLGFAALAAFLTPYFFTILGLQFLRFTAFEGQGPEEPDADDTEGLAVYRTLTGLGFRHAGWTRERMWFSQHHWYKTFRLQVLQSRDGRTFAALYRLFPSEPPRIALDSITDQGVFVRTVTPGAGIPETEPDYRRVELPQATPERLLVQHSLELDRAAATGAGRPVTATLTERAAIDERIEHRSLGKIGLGDVAWFPLFGWGVPFLFVFLITTFGSELGWERRVSFALLAAAISYIVFTCLLLPAILAIELGAAGVCDAGQQDEDRG
ncbi:MAG: hypothetical protein ACRC7O_05990 [Fimbriiglobus sp.]